MDDIVEIIARGYIPFIANVGVLAILAWCVSLFGHRFFSTAEFINPRYSLPIGIVFGLCAALLMIMPVEFEPGIIGDARGAPILMSGILGGPVAAAVTAVVAGGTRYLLGGAGWVSGTLYVIVFAVAGAAWRHFALSRKVNEVSILGLIGLASLATAITSPQVLLFPENKQLPILLNLWPKLWIANIIGVVILGTLIRREKERHIAELALIEQTVLAQRAAEAKSRFLTAMSHEIRTPLNGVLGILQLVLKRPIPDTVADDLKVARDSGIFLLNLVNPVLDFARIESGKTIITRQDFSVSTLLDGLHSMFMHQSEAKGLNFSVHLVGPTETRVPGITSIFARFCSTSWAMP